MSRTKHRLETSNIQEELGGKAVATKSPMSFQGLKQAVDEYFKTRYTVCELKHDEQHVAMLWNVGKPYSPVTTWLYVAKDETGRHYITTGSPPGKMLNS